ncbi:MAG: dihydropteroate synthase [Candidatus Omnitrophica bacterium]|nr:dihydropteroate synthase [Candidatus Omnitrophota bacterium]
MFIIGELINGMYKNVQEALSKKDEQAIINLAKQQEAEGANALDVNCGPLSKDPVSDMKWLVSAIQKGSNLPLAIDSTKPNVIQAGLELIKGKAIINSTSADPERLEIYVNMAKKYNASLIALTMDKKGVPQDKDRRLELAAQILAFAQEKDFNINNIYLDPIVLPVNVAQPQLKMILEVLHEFKVISDPAPKTVVGLSNVSQGSCQRNIINRVFLTMAIGYGLDAAIVDPLDKELMDAVITSDLLLNKHIYCDSFLSAYRKK